MVATTNTMSEVVSVREARAEDEPARVALLADVLAESFLDTFLYFLFQEVTLQGVVLCGAVAFIFLGWGPTASCCAVPLLAAAAVAGCVRVALADRAAALAAAMRGEDHGWVSVCGRGEGRVCGTVSVRGTRVCALGVARAWRRRGAGAALLHAAARHATTRALLSHLEARVSDLQPHARDLFYKQGWELRGTYHHPVCGGVLSLSLPVAVLAREMPHTA